MWWSNYSRFKITIVTTVGIHPLRYSATCARSLLGRRGFISCGVNLEKLSSPPSGFFRLVFFAHCLPATGKFQEETNSKRWPSAIYFCWYTVTKCIERMVACMRTSACMHASCSCQLPNISMKLSSQELTSYQQSRYQPSTSLAARVSHVYWTTSVQAEGRSWLLWRRKPFAIELRGRGQVLGKPRTARKRVVGPRPAEGPLHSASGNRW